MIPVLAIQHKGRMAGLGRGLGGFAARQPPNPGDEHERRRRLRSACSSSLMPRPLALATNWVSALGDTPGTAGTKPFGSAFRPSADSWRPKDVVLLDDAVPIEQNTTTA